MVTRPSKATAALNFLGVGEGNRIQSCDCSVLYCTFASSVCSLVRGTFLAGFDVEVLEDIVMRDGEVKRD